MTESSPKAPRRATRSGDGSIDHTVSWDMPKELMRPRVLSSLRCPKCSGVNIECELKGILEGPDTNRARCSCGWEGTVEQAKSAA